MPLLSNPFKVTHYENLGAPFAQEACERVFLNGVYIYSEKVVIEDIAVGTTLFTTAEDFEGWNGGFKWYGIGDISSNSPQVSVLIDFQGIVVSVNTCTGGAPAPPPVPPPVAPPPTTPPTPPAPPAPNTDLTYAYFVLRNLSRSRKIFGYYSGSQDYPYTFNTSTSSGDPGTGLIRLNKGSAGSGGTTNEIQSTEIFVDIKDKNEEEDIITYLTSLSESVHTSPDPETNFGEVQIVVSGSDFFFHRFDLKDVTLSGSSPVSSGYFVLSGSSIASGPNSNANPLSSSIAVGSGSVVELKFYNDILPGYYQTEVGGLDTDHKLATITQTASYGSGSISEPFAIDWGTTEAQFINDNFYPSTRGYAWLWNDGYKVKHIKMNNTSFTGDILSDFIKRSIWSRFVLYNPTKADGSLLYNTTGNYPETYYLLNVTKYTRQGYTHLFVDQDNKGTTFATDSQNFASTNFNFLAEGQYIIYATSSGDIVTPTSSSGYTSSLAQGYFPSASSGYPTEQFFRGWAGANYYNNGSLVSTGGSYEDSLFQFNTGSTERDYDNAPAFLRSQLPFFINATSSYIPIYSQSIETYTGQANSVKIGPTITTEEGNHKVKYYYNEPTGKILIEGGQYLDQRKSKVLDYDNKSTVELLSTSNDIQYYTTPDGYIITIYPSQSLWLTRGRDNIGARDTDRYLYNRYAHRPYKAYVVTTTGSVEEGYGVEGYGTGSYGSGSQEQIISQSFLDIINEVGTVYMHYSQSAASLRNDGVYTFTSDLTENVGLTASALLDYTSVQVIRPSHYGTASYGNNEFEYGGSGSGGDIITWKTASLKIYKGSSVLASEDIYLSPDIIANKPRITVKYPLTTGQITAGDTLKLSLSVSTTSTESFNSSLIATSYTMSIGAPVPPTDDKIPVTFNNYLELNDDCTPTLNNISSDRPNERLQDVDYSVDINSPINFDQIIKDEAVRATVPESNFTQIGFTNQRYVGSSLTRANINEFDPSNDVDFLNRFVYNVGSLSNIGKGADIGQVPNVEFRNSYIAYFNELVDPYPNLNNKTAYYVKYLIDESGTIFDPTLSDINYSIFDKTFQLNDYDNKPTRVKTSLQNIQQAKELSKLNQGLSSTFKVGEYPVPILYSQNSSTTHVNVIPLSGSKFYTDLGLGESFSDFSFEADATSSAAFASNNDASVEFGETILTFKGTGDDIIINPDGTGSYVSDGKFEFPDDYNADFVGAGNNLSDNYTLNGQFKFYTTSVPPAYEFLGKYVYEDDKPCKVNFMTFNFNVYQKTPTGSTYSKTKSGFTFNGLTLRILTNADTSTPIAYNIPIPLGTQQSNRGTTNGLKVTNSGVSLDLNSHWLYRQIAQLQGQSWNQNGRRAVALLIGGGWEGQGLEATAVQWEWILDFSLGSTQNYLKQGSGYYFSAEGTMVPNKECRRENRDAFTNFKGSDYNKNNGFRWKRSYFPKMYGNERFQPELLLELTSPLSETANRNGAKAPYWRRVPNTTNELYMSSSILNQAYALIDEEGNSDKYFIQGKIPYTGSSNPDFPSTQEPSFVEFDPVTDIWSLEIGDEIRFENSEDLVFTITSIDGKEAITPPVFPNENEDINKKLKVIVSPSFENNEPSNFDFFVVRRYKENKNFIILDQQKPYGFPVSQSSSPGILLPEHRIEKYNRNPDEVLKDLIEKRII